jgi:hypothetical protein
LPIFQKTQLEILSQVGLCCEKKKKKKKTQNNSFRNTPKYTKQQITSSNNSTTLNTLKILIRGVKAVTVSGYWQKPLTVTTLAVIKFH